MDQIKLCNVVIECFFHISEKLGVETDTVQHGVEGLVHLLTESSKLMVRQ